MKHLNITFLLSVVMSLLCTKAYSHNNLVTLTEENPTFSPSLYYRIITRNGDTSCLDITGEKSHEGGTICLWSNISTRTTEDWIVKKVGNYYQFLSRNGGFAINDPSPAGTVATSTTVVQLNLAKADMSSQSQLWNIVPQSDGYFNIINVRTQRTMCINGGSKANGTAIVSYKSDSNNTTSKNRQWCFEVNDSLKNLFVGEKNSDGVMIYYNWIKNYTELSVSYRGTSYSEYSNEYTGKVVIPETVTYDGNTYPVTSVGDEAFSGCIGLESVIIPNSVTSIGDNAFDGCKGLTSITIPNSVTSIGSLTFSGCTGLTNITIPNSVTSIGSSAFSDCLGLTSVIIGNSVTSIGASAFNSCSRLTTVTVGNSVTSIGKDAFYQCTGLNVINRIIDIATWCKADPITYENNRSNPMYYAKEIHLYKDNGTEITDLVIPDEVTSIRSSAFSKCVSLKSVTIPNSVTSIGNSTFMYCIGLTKVTLHCKEIDSWFNSLSNIKEVVIGNEVTSIGSKAFSDCTSLSNVTIEDGDNILKFSDTNNYKTFGSCPITYLYLGRNISYDSYYSPFRSFNSLKDLTIGNRVTSISNSAFYGCTGLSNIIIPNSITSIGQDAFSGCTGLNVVNRIIDIASWCKADPITYGNSYSNPMYYAKELHLYKDNDTEIIDLVIPDEVTSICSGAFSKCINLKSVTIPNSVESIGRSAFEVCTGLSNVRFMDGDNALKFSDANNSKTFANCPITTLYLGRNLSYQYSPFQSLNTLKDVTIGNNVTSIGNSTFYGCTGITSIEIPNRVKDIGQSSFYGCSYLASVKIGNGVTSIGKDAFYGCSNLSAVHIENLTNWCSISFENSDANPLCCAKHLYLGNNEINDLVIPNNVTQISFSSFYGCTGFTSIKIPTSVTSIGNFAFSGCTGLTSLEIPNSVSNLGNNAFYDCNYLLKVTIESNSIVSKSYSYSYSLKNIFGAQVQQYIIGENVSSIGDYAFYGYNQSTSIALPDNITQIGYNAIPSNVMLFVNKGTKTLLTCWNKSFIPYDKQTEVKLMAPALSVEDITQTKATVKILNTDLKDGYNYSINNEAVNNINIKYTALRPETTQQLKLVVSLDDVHYDVTDSYTTKGMNTKVDDNYKVTASSIRATGSYTEEDAKVIAQRMYILNQPSEGNECFASGLNPGRSYTIICEIDVDYGGESIETYRASRNIYPARLQFNVAQPKVVKIGNAIVSATVNLDPEEENIGFEWRRTDWTDEFPSNTGQAYLYEGVIEGFIKNLNTDKLWKFRPYYLSDDGTYHYGDWMGLDPTNTSYFEPTVHTYARINIEGNTALVRGYALAGTENIKVQGFKYWKTSQGSNASHQAPSVPANAKTIVATGQQIITATLAALDYNSIYHYVAFVTTEDGTTYYGEEQVFTTPMAPAGIDDVIVDTPTTTKKGVYTLTGVKLADDLSKLQGLSQGVYIINGKKVMVK